jgi:hypothetical protein
MDPLSLTALAGLALSEGIKFLYTQASEVLKKRRERQEGKEEEAHEPVPLQASGDLLEGALQPPTVDFEKLDQVAGDLEALRAVLEKQAVGATPAEAPSGEVIEAAEAVRRALELVYGQRITFKGEDRPPSGPVVIGHAEATKVTGDLAGVRARLARGGQIEGTAVADEVSGRVSGVDIDTID